MKRPALQDKQFGRSRLPMLRAVLIILLLCGFLWFSRRGERAHLWVRLQPNNPVAHISLADYYQWRVQESQGFDIEYVHYKVDFLKAITEYRIALRLDPSSTDAQQKLAESLLQLRLAESKDAQH